MSLKKLTSLIVCWSLVFNTIAMAAPQAKVAAQVETVVAPLDQADKDVDPNKKPDQLKEETAMALLIAEMKTCLKENGEFEKGKIKVEADGRSHVVDCDNARIVDYNINLGDKPKDPQAQATAFCNATKGLKPYEAIRFAKSLEDMGLITHINNVISCPGKNISNLSCLNPKKLPCYVFGEEEEGITKSAIGALGFDWNSCKGAGKNGCIANLLEEAFKSLISDFKAIGSLASSAASYVGDKVSGWWNGMWGDGEKKSSNVAQVAEKLTDEDIKQFDKKGNKSILDKMGSFMGDAMKWLDQGMASAFMCPFEEQFEDENGDIQCKKPVTSFSCGDCNQRVMGLCRLVGFIVKEAGIAVLMGGAFNVAMKGAKMVKGTKYARAIGSSLKNSKLLSKMKGLGRFGVYQLRRVGGKLHLAPMGKMTPTFRNWYLKAAKAMKNSKAAALAGKAGSKLSALKSGIGGSRFGQIAGLLTKPINPKTYLNLMDDAFMLGFKGPKGMMAARKARQISQIKNATLAGRSKDISKNPKVARLLQRRNQAEDSLIGSYENLNKLLKASPKDKSAIGAAHARIAQLEKKRKVFGQQISRAKAQAAEELAKKAALAETKRVQQLKAAAAKKQLQIETKQAALKAKLSTMQDGSLKKAVVEKMGNRRIEKLKTAKAKALAKAKDAKRNKGLFNTALDSGAVNKDIVRARAQRIDASKALKENDNFFTRRAYKKAANNVEKQVQILETAKEMANPNLAAQGLAKGSKVASKSEEVSKVATKSDDVVKAVTKSDDVVKAATKTDDVVKAATKTDDVAKSVTKTDDLSKAAKGDSIELTYNNPKLGTKGKRSGTLADETPKSYKIQEAGKSRPTIVQKRHLKPEVKSLPNSKLKASVAERKLPKDAKLWAKGDDVELTYRNPKNGINGKLTGKVVDQTEKSVKVVNAANPKGRWVQKKFLNLDETKNFNRFNDFKIADEVRPGSSIVLMDKSGNPATHSFVRANDKSIVLNGKSGQQTIRGRDLNYGSASVVQPEAKTARAAASTQAKAVASSPVDEVLNQFDDITVFKDGKAVTGARVTEGLKDGKDVAIVNFPNGTRHILDPEKEVLFHGPKGIQIMKKSSVEAIEETSKGIARLTEGMKRAKGAAKARLAKWLGRFKSTKNAQKISRFKEIAKSKVQQWFKLPNGKKFKGTILGFKNGRMLIKLPSGKIVQLRTSSAVFAGLLVTGPVMASTTGLGGLMDLFKGDPEPKPKEPVVEQKDPTTVVNTPDVVTPKDDVVEDDKKDNEDDEEELTDDEVANLLKNSPIDPMLGSPGVRQPQMIVVPPIGVIMKGGLI